MTGFMRWLAVSLMLLFPPAAWGHGLGLRSRSVTYYSPVTVQFAPVVACVRVVPVCPAPAYLAPVTQVPRMDQTFARPTAAPPSSTTETPAPPLAVPQAPKSPAPPSPTRSSDVRESRSYYDAYAGSPRDSTKPAGDRCTIGFWNLTGGNLTIKVDGQARSLPQGKNLQVEAGRQFIWQVEGRDPQRESIAAGESALEIVIRR
jgi:hypothetical protein